MACVTWETYCNWWNETGLFDDNKLFGTTYTHDCPVYYGIKGELFPIEISGNTAAESIYIAKSNTLGEFYVGLPAITSTRSFQLMMHYCNPVTVLLDGCKCFTMSFKPPEENSSLYTLEYVLAAITDTNQKGYILDGKTATWSAGSKSIDEIKAAYPNLPLSWIKAYIFDYSLESIEGLSKPKAQIRGSAININDDKDTKPTDPLKAITPIMDAALARLAQSGDATKIELAKAFKKIDKVESTLDCGEDIFCLASNSPTSGNAIQFTGCISRLKGKTKLTFGPSIKDLIQVKLTFDKLFETLSATKTDTSDTSSKEFMTYTSLCQIFGWDNSNISSCCSSGNYTHLLSPSTGTGSWKDADLWSKESFFFTHSDNPISTDPDEPHSGIIKRKSYAHFMLSTAPLLKRLIFSHDLINAIKECFESLSGVLVAQGKKADGSDSPADGCGDCTFDIDQTYCSGCPYGTQEGESFVAGIDLPIELRKDAQVKNFCSVCSNGSKLTTNPICTGLKELETLEQLIFTKRLTTAILQASCSSTSCRSYSETYTPSQQGIHYIVHCSSCSTPSELCQPCGTTECLHGCASSGTSVDVCNDCPAVTQINLNGSCSINVESTDSYEIVKYFYKDKTSCLLETVTTTNANFNIPFLRLNFDNAGGYVDKCLQGTPPTASITIPTINAGTKPYDPTNPDDPDNPKNGGDGNLPVPGGENGSGDKNEGSSGGYPAPDPSAKCPDDTMDIDDTKPTIPGLYYFASTKTQMSTCRIPCIINNKATTIIKPIYKITQKWVLCNKTKVHWIFPKVIAPENEIMDLGLLGCTVAQGQQTALQWAINIKGQYQSLQHDTGITVSYEDGNSLYYVAQDKAKPLLRNSNQLNPNIEPTFESDNSSWTINSENNIPGIRAISNMLSEAVYNNDADVTCPGGIHLQGSYAVDRICGSQGSTTCGACSCTLGTIGISYTAGEYMQI